MSRYTYEIEVNDPDLNIYYITEFQQITISRGRTQIQDPAKAGYATITGRDPSQLANYKIGYAVYIYCEDSQSNKFQLFSGVISDIKINYGIIPALDVWELTVEDAISLLGKRFSKSVSYNAGYTTEFAAKNSGYSSLSPRYTSFTSGSTVSAQTFSDVNALDLVNKLLYTEQGRIVCDGVATSIFWINRTDIGLMPVVGAFSDNIGTPGLTKAPYNNVVFRSFAESYFTKVLVEPAGLASQESGSGNFVFSVNTFDQSTAQAKNLADYILATLTVNQGVPQSVSFISENQTNNVVVDAFANVDNCKAELVFRGATYNVFVLGGTLSADPAQTRITLNVASSEAVNFFILDSSTFGVLDTNKLGF